MNTQVHKVFLITGVSSGFGLAFSHYLQDMSKAIIDDVVKVLAAPCNNRASNVTP